MKGYYKKITLLLSGWVFLILCVSGVSSFADEVEGASLQPASLIWVGIERLRQIEPNLTGAGVRFAVISRSITYKDGQPQDDYRPDVNHNCFSNKHFRFYDEAVSQPGVSRHSTAICSILFGQDANAVKLSSRQVGYRGVVPDARADVYEFWHFLKSKVFPSSPLQADILTAGMGVQYPQWWSRGIERMCQEQGLLVVGAIGNGSDVADPVLYPAAGANAIGVGVVDSVQSSDVNVSLSHFSLTQPEHSSFGPSADLRCKPDIVAPADCLIASVDKPNQYEAAGNWSSFSMPVVAGTLGMLVQKAKADPNLSMALPSTKGGNCVLKAILLNSAEKLPYWHKGLLSREDDHNVPLDYAQGAGMVDAVAAYENLVSGRVEPNGVSPAGWDNNKLSADSGIGYVYSIELDNGDEKMLSATLVWNKHYEAAYPFNPQPERDSDLRLELWAVDANNPDNNYLVDYSDSPNDNVEHIYHRTDAGYSDYILVVLNNGAIDANFGESRYALAWSVTDSRQADAAEREICWFDLEADGIIDINDADILINNSLKLAEQPWSYYIGDITADGAIDHADFKVFMDNLGRRAPWYQKVGR